MARAIGSANKKKQAMPQKYLCPYCGEPKIKTEFYTSSDPMIKTGITTMCRDCARILREIMMKKAILMETVQGLLCKTHSKD